MTTPDTDALVPLAAVLAIIREQPYYYDTHVGRRQQWVKDEIERKVAALTPTPPGGDDAGLVERLLGEAHLTDTGGKAYQVHLPPLLREAAARIEALSGEVKEQSARRENVVGALEGVQAHVRTIVIRAEKAEAALTEAQARAERLEAALERIVARADIDPNFGMDAIRGALDDVSLIARDTLASIRSPDPTGEDGRVPEEGTPVPSPTPQETPKETDHG